MNISELIDKLIKNGGAIVSSDACETTEIAIARACGNFAIHDSFGLVLKPKGWVEAAKEGLAHRIYDAAMSLPPTTPPSAKPNETSGATADDGVLSEIAKKWAVLYFNKHLEASSVVDAIYGALKELNAVRKSAGAEGDLREQLFEEQRMSSDIIEALQKTPSWDATDIDDIDTGYAHALRCIAHLSTAVRSAGAEAFTQEDTQILKDDARRMRGEIERLTSELAVAKSTPGVDAVPEAIEALASPLTEWRKLPPDSNILLVDLNAVKRLEHGAPHASVEEAIETGENILAATQLLMPAPLHVEGLKGGIEKMIRQLRANRTAARTATREAFHEVHPDAAGGGK